MKARYAFGVIGMFVIMGNSQSTCSGPPTSNDIQRDMQEKLVAEGNQKTGMPAIHNFRERNLLKTILEMRDQSNFITYTYLWNEMQGKYVFLCQSIGYPIPYATQYTAPISIQRYNVKDGDGNWAYGTHDLPQADPNGLFSPAAADGTWVLCKNPKSDDLKPIYAEPKVITSPFKLDQ